MPLPLLPLIGAAARIASVATRLGRGLNVFTTALGTATRASARFPGIDITATMRGLPELKRELQNLTRDVRRRIARLALSEGARLVRDEARRAAPVLNRSSLAVRKGYRKPGTVRKAIVVRTSKVARRRGDVGVFVNVRPAKAVRRGGKNPGDPFYWRWLEFGWRPRGAVVRGKSRPASASAGRRVPGFKFLQAGANYLASALPVILDRMRREIEKYDRRA